MSASYDEAFLTVDYRYRQETWNTELLLVRWLLPAVLSGLLVFIGIVLLRALHGTLGPMNDHDRTFFDQHRVLFQHWWFFVVAGAIAYPLQSLVFTRLVARNPQLTELPEAWILRILQEGLSIPYCGVEGAACSWMSRANLPVVSVPWSAIKRIVVTRGRGIWSFRIEIAEEEQRPGTPTCFFLVRQGLISPVQAQILQLMKVYCRGTVEGTV